MKYLHPDVLDSILIYLRDSAQRAVLIPNYTTDYDTVAATELVSIPLTAADFTITDMNTSEGSGRKLVFPGKVVLAAKDAPPNANLHVAYTDGISRVLWIEEVNKATILAGQNYRLPLQSSLSPQPNAAV